MVKQLKMNEAEAQQIALKALQFIAGDEDSLVSFLGVTGLGPSTLRQAAQDPSFFNAVLTFISDDEKRLLSCSSAINVKPEDVFRAYEQLVGYVHEFE
jgi:Protein of unknown function (DUF3572)